jgi:hypothetical protein
MSLSESDLQIAIFRWAATLEPTYPELKWLHHVPNGGKRDSKTAGLLKAQGAKAGILDLALDVPKWGFEVAPDYYGWRCELKKPDGKTPKYSKEQAEYAVFLQANGYYVLLSNDFEEVKASLVWYLG